MNYSTQGNAVVMRSPLTGDVKEYIAECSTQENARRMAARLQRERDNSDAWDVEVTDTMGGDANYSWVKRYTFRAPKTASNREVMRRAKRAADFTNARGRTESHGDVFAFYPSGLCVVMFVNFKEPNA
jgi:hypothetical protein